MNQLFDTSFARTRGYIGEALRTGMPQCVELVPREMEEHWPSLAPLLREFPVTSLIVVPLCASGKLLGAIWAGRADGEPALAAPELEFVQDAARVIGKSVEAALLSEKAIADRAGTDGSAPRGADTRAGVAGEKGLTQREAEVLRLLALGHTNREAAEQLHLSTRTVEWHRARLQWKLGSSGRAELVRAARELGLVGDA
jgi:DNA-binding CsgD family transcriptional regulator